MNELIPKDITGGELVDFDEVTSSGDAYLTRLQLFGSKSDACAEGKISIGHWGLVNDDVIIDLGEEVDLVILAYRAKALQIDNDGIITNHDVRSETFNAIREQSFVQDSGCMFGPEFLVYIPSNETFATYFASSKTSRREAKGTIKLLIGSAATFKCKLIDPPASKYKWHGPIVTPCSTPMDLPDLKIISEMINKFKHPVADEVEIADDDTRER